MEFNLFENMVSLEHLFECWDLFRRGKRENFDVQVFERHREDNIFSLRDDLMSLEYKHGAYFQFDVFEPKKRNINAASVKDRLVHQIVFSVLSKVFDKRFIFHSFSNRANKGTHLGSSFLTKMLCKSSLNGTRSCYALKMDVRKFFDHVDHSILKMLIRRVIGDEKMLKIVDIIIDSFQMDGKRIGLPLGNLTSQLFSNIYLHELDVFVKHKLRKKFYLRYCDDFIIVSHDLSELKELVPLIGSFLNDSLRLTLHPKKIILRKLSQGIDFLGYIHFLHHKLMRVSTKKRMLRRLHYAQELFFANKITPTSMDQRLQSYLGLLSHANQHNLSQAIKNAF